MRPASGGPSRPDREPPPRPAARRCRALSGATKPSSRRERTAEAGAFASPTAGRARPPALAADATAEAIALPTAGSARPPAPAADATAGAFASPTAGRACRSELAAAAIAIPHTTERTTAGKTSSARRNKPLRPTRSCIKCPLIVTAVLADDRTTASTLVQRPEEERTEKPRAARPAYPGAREPLLPRRERDRDCRRGRPVLGDCPAHNAARRSRASVSSMSSTANRTEPSWLVNWRSTRISIGSVTSEALRGSSSGLAEQIG